MEFSHAHSLSCSKADSLKQLQLSERWAEDTSQDRGGVEEYRIPCLR